MTCARRPALCSARLPAHGGSPDAPPLPPLTCTALCLLPIPGKASKRLEAPGLSAKPVPPAGSTAPGVGGARAGSRVVSGADAQQALYPAFHGRVSAEPCVGQAPGKQGRGAAASSRGPGG